MLNLRIEEATRKVLRIPSGDLLDHVRRIRWPLWGRERQSVARAGVQRTQLDRNVVCPATSTA